MRRHALLIDGYNILGQMESFSSLEDARDALAALVADYAGFTGRACTLVFDGYNVVGGKGSETMQAGIRVVFTKQDETADVYIERMTTLLVQDGYEVTVATGDAVEQGLVLGLGGYRMSAREFLDEMKEARKQRRKQFPKGDDKRYVFHTIDGDTLQRLEELRTEG